MHLWQFPSKIAQKPWIHFFTNFATKAQKLGLLNQVVFNVLKNPNPLKDDEASAVLDAAVLF